MEINAAEVWSNIKNRLKNELDSEVYEGYFAPITEIYKEQNNFIYLVVENEFYKARIQSNYIDRLNAVLLEYYPTPHRFQLITKNEIIEEEDKKNENFNKVNFTKSNKSGLNPNYTFSNFVVGDSNRFAHRYATMVAEQLAAVANPVYIFGDVGLGKTHLMQAIGNYVAESKPELQILYIRTQDFVEEYVKCLKNGYEEFYKKFEHLDVLLVDDIQFLESKQQCQLEFFKIFERLTADKKLVVITSDKKASDLRDIMARLTSRFEWGIALDISKPDKEHRISILNSKIKQEMPNPEKMPQEVIDYIATVCESNIRELEGALKRVLFFCDAFSLDYNLENAKEALKNIVNFSDAVENSVAPNEEIKKMLNVVCAYFKIDQDDLLSNSRKKEVVYARQICWYLMRTKYDLTYQKIGDIFNGKDHSTIMHGCEIIEVGAKSDEDTKKNVENILRKMGKDPNQA